MVWSGCTAVVVMLKLSRGVMINFAPCRLFEQFVASRFFFNVEYSNIPPFVHNGSRKNKSKLNVRHSINFQAIIIQRSGKPKPKTASLCPSSLHRHYPASDVIASGICPQFDETIFSEMSTVHGKFCTFDPRRLRE